MKGFIDRIPLGWICLFIIPACLISLAPSWYQYDIISMDGAFQYIPVAELYLNGTFIEALMQKQLPLFPMLLALFSWITGFDLEMSGRLISIISFCIAAIGLFRLTVFVNSSRISGLIAVLFMITSRVLLYCSVDCLKESLLLCIIIWANYLILSGTSSEKKSYSLIVSGFILLFTGALLRSTANLFILAWLILWVIHERRLILYRLIGLLLPILLVLIVWLIKPDLPVFVRSYDLNQLFGKEFNLMSLLSGVWGAVDSMFSAGNQGAFVFSLLGFFTFRKNVLYKHHVGLTLLLFLFVYSFWGFASDRYSLAPVIMTYPLAASLIMESMKSAKKLFAAVAFAVLLFSPAQWIYNSTGAPDPDKIAQKDAGRWILSVRGPGHEVMTNRERLAFYAKSKLILVNVPEDIKNFSSVIAVDRSKEGGSEMIESIEHMGLHPSNIIAPVYIFFPKK
ncbi:MAG TPA: hypothetical protein VIS94_02965 [Desulfomonilia bacterium]